MLILLFNIVLFTGCDNLNSKVVTEESTIQTTTDNKTNEEVDKLKKEISILEENLRKKQVSIERLEEERDYYVKSIDFMLEKLSEDEIKEIIEKEWWYTLSIVYSENDDKKYKRLSVPKNGIITLNNSDFNVVFSEHNELYHVVKAKDKYKKLLEEVLIGNWSDNIKVKNYDDYFEAAGSGTVVDSMSYQFKNVPKGTEIKIEISEKLRKRLELESNILSISIK
jgi:hypothetical protein